MYNFSVAESPELYPGSNDAGECVIEIRDDFVLARRNFHVKSETVQQIAPPWQRLSAGGKLQACQIGDRTRRPVLAGNPFRIVERERPGLGGNVQLRVEDLARRFRRVHRERDGRTICPKNWKR